ncbi:MAG: hypothetical protein ABI467_16130 [Kofleriaceae bacterium]
MANTWVLAVVQTLLFGHAHASDCASQVDPVRCSISSRFAQDARAQALATDLYAKTGDIATVGLDEVMDGGFRGKIHLVPELPVGKYRKHLAWVSIAMTAIDELYAKQFVTAKPNYRWRDLTFRFVRSVGKHTPSAYAWIGADAAWTIEYNVEGSLLTSATGVRETLVHELFHVNDESHEDWSQHALAGDFKAIVKKCGTKVGCLAPYAPNDTKVRATGNYYAFQPNNGNVVHEYAAELAVRYWREQSEMLANGKLAGKAFKCGPPENARSWRALVDEFFGGVDRVPGC